MDSATSAKRVRKTAPKRPKCSLDSTNVLPPYIHLRDGRWYCRRYFPRGDGKYNQVVRRVDPETPEQAALVSEQIESLYKQAQIKRARAQTVSEIVNEFVEAKKIAVEPRTFDYYEWLYTKYLKGSFGSLTAEEVKTKMVQDFYSTIPKSMVRKVHNFLSMVFIQAIRWEVLHKNPTEGVVLPKKVKPTITIMTEDEAKQFMATCLEHFPVLAFALETWMRPQEYLALEWPSIRGNEVKVTRAVTVPKGGGYRYKEPKTESGKRTILISDRIKELLASLPRKSNLVFPLGKAQMLPHYLNEQIMTSACQKAEIPRYTVYALRHTGASIALANGANIKDVSERLGHASTHITWEIYTHVLPKTRNKTVEILSEALY